MRFQNSLTSQSQFDQHIIPNINKIVATHSPNSLDNQVDDILDPALNISPELFKETLKHSIDHHYSRFMVGMFMKKLQSADPGFQYRVF